MPARLPNIMTRLARHLLNPSAIVMLPLSHDPLPLPMNLQYGNAGQSFSFRGNLGSVTSNGCLKLILKSIFLPSMFKFVLANKLYQRARNIACRIGERVMTLLELTLKAGKQLLFISFISHILNFESSIFNYFLRGRS